MKFNNIFLCMVTVFFTQLSQSMDNLVLAGNKVIAWDVILVHDKSLFSHNMIRSLAVNREFERRLCKTAQERKQYCVSLASSPIYKNILKKSGMWHKYGSAWGVVSYINDPLPDANDWLHFERLDLVDGGQMQYKSHIETGFSGFLSVYSLSFTLPNYRKRFFDASDNFCCYGYSNKNLNGGVGENTVVLYKLSPCGFNREIIVPGENMNKKEVVVNEPLDLGKGFAAFCDGIIEFFKSA